MGRGSHMTLCRCGSKHVVSLCMCRRNSAASCTCMRGLGHNASTYRRPGRPACSTSRICQRIIVIAHPDIAASQMPVASLLPCCPAGPAPRTIAVDAQLLCQQVGRQLWRLSAPRQSPCMPSSSTSILAASCASVAVCIYVKLLYQLVGRQRWRPWCDMQKKTRGQRVGRLWVVRIHLSACIVVSWGAVVSLACHEGVGRARRNLSCMLWLCVSVRVPLCGRM